MSQVIIGDILPYTQAIAIASQTVFGTNWTANYASDVVVYQTPSGDEPDDVTQILSYPSEYSVAFIGDQQEVQVTLVTPAGAGDIITITRQTPADRQNVYTNTNFTPSMLNNDFGILTLVDQQAQLVNQLIGPRYNYSSVITDVVDTILPLLPENSTWVKNSNNTAIIPYLLPVNGIAPAEATYVTATNQTSTLPNSYLLQAGTNVTLTPGVNVLTISVTGQAINPGTINDLAYYAVTGSAVSPLSTANNGVLVTSAGGVPSISSTLPSGLTIPSPYINQIVDSNGNIVARFELGNSGSDEFIVLSNGTLGDPASIYVDGTPINIQLDLYSKGTGQITFNTLAFSNAVSWFTGTTYQHQTVWDFADTAATRTVTWPDATGTIAFTSDIPSLPLSAANGGTGVSSPTAHGIMIAEGASAMTSIVLSSGQILIGSTGVDPVAAAINSGTGILVGNGAGSITVGLAAIASHDILSNITGGSAAPIANTLTATIDAAIGSTQGNILYRSATAWNVLAPGTSGQFFTTGGPAANPSWTSQVAPTGAALTRVDDTNITLTLGGSPTVALLAAASITAGWTGTLSGTRGGTGVNNGANTATFAGNLNFANSFTTLGNFAVTHTYTGVTGVTYPTSGTLATTSQLVTPSALTKTDDTNVTLTLGGSPSTALVNAASLTLGWTGQLSLTRGGTNASLTASNGGIVYSTASALAILSGTATANQMFQSGSSTTPAWSTATWPATTTINQLLYSSSANTVAGLASANNGILVTSAGGVPSIGNTVGAGLTMPSITFNTTTGVVGTTTNNSAAAGSVGEYMSSVVPNSTVSLTSNTSADATSLTLTAGDWDVWGNVAFNGAAGTLAVINIGWISTTSATLPNSELYSTQFYSGAGTAIYAVAPASFCVPGFRVSVANAATQIVYLSVRSAFSVSTSNAGGGLYARRVR